MCAMNTAGAAAIRLNAAWLTRIIAMLESTSPSRNFFTSAPAEKNFSLALRTITARTSPPIASSTASENACMTSRS